MQEVQTEQDQHEKSKMKLDLYYIFEKLSHFKGELQNNIKWHY